jgi:type IV pilus assembly protein PilA
MNRSEHRSDRQLARPFDRRNLRRARTPIRRGFTLLELMVVVVIVGVLSAIAIPNFLRYRLRVKATEVATNLGAIRTSQTVLWSENGQYIAVTSPVPSSLPGTRPANWPGANPFDQLGWAPEGRVYYQYVVNADSAGAGRGFVRYTAEAISDIDSNGATNHWAFMKPAPGTSSALSGALPGSTCASTGVFNPITGNKDVLEGVGPCDSRSGRIDF